MCTEQAQCTGIYVLNRQNVQGYVYWTGKIYRDMCTEQAKHTGICVRLGCQRACVYTGWTWRTFVVFWLCLLCIKFARVNKKGKETLKKERENIVQWQHVTTYIKDMWDFPKPLHWIFFINQQEEVLFSIYSIQYSKLAHYHPPRTWSFLLDGSIGKIQV